MITVPINPAILYKIITHSAPIVEGYQEVERELTSSDHEDGGGHYDLIIKHLESGKLYLVNYCDWDIENTDYDEDDEETEITGRCDLPEEMVEVYAKEVVVTKYVPVQ